MNSRNHSDDLLDIRLKHTLKNWVARKEAPEESREQLLVAALQQNAFPKSNNSIKQGLDRLFHSKTTLSERSVFPGYGYALDTVFVIRASMTVA
jgi:hypothetical protein